MKRMYFWILAIVLAVPFLPAGVRAAVPQGGGMGGPGGGMGRRGPMSPDDRLKQMTKNFNLTADQQAKIKPILVDEQKKMEDARNDSSGDRREMRGKMRQIFQDSNTQIRALLDDTQKAKFDKLEQERMDRMRSRRGGGMGGPGGSGGPGGANGDNTNPPPAPQN